MLIAPKLAALAAAQGGPFTTAQARAVGYDPREIHRLLRSRQWTALRRGVYAETTLIPSDAVISARRIGIAQRRFCSSVPKDSRDAAMMPTPWGLKQ